MHPLPPRLRTGTSSFSSKDWFGPFYPADLPPGDMLGFYARRFDTVEVDATYYRAPSAAMCAKWNAVTPDGFAFALKAPKSITAEKALAGCRPEWDAFMKAADRLGRKLRFVLLQFGYFNRQSACPTLDDFLSRLRAFLAEVPDRSRLVVEIRNPKWVVEELLAFLREHNVGFAITEQEWMPKPRALFDMFGPKLRTAADVYVRFLGERKKIEAITTTWEKTVIDRTEALREAIPVLQSFLDQDVPVWAYFNNHYAGHAPASIELLKNLWPYTSTPSPV